MSVFFFFFFSSRRRHTRCSRDWSSDVCSSDLERGGARFRGLQEGGSLAGYRERRWADARALLRVARPCVPNPRVDRKSTRLNSSHGYISYAVFCLKKKKQQRTRTQPSGESCHNCGGSRCVPRRC